MIEAETVEHRVNMRRRCYLGGRVVFNERSASMSCLVKNISELGARLEFGACPALPETLELILDSQAASAPARIVWRHLNNVGIAFDQPQSKRGKKGLAVNLLMDAMPIPSRRVH